MISADIDMQIVARDKAITLLFSRETDAGTVPALTDNMMLDPETALLAAQLMTDLAFEADSGLKPMGPALKASLIEKHRSILLPRLKVILSSTRGNRKITHEQLAVQLLDVFCHEVFA